ncbi:MAG: DUF6675 family protein [Geminicoccaceae bacterium]
MPTAWRAATLAGILWAAGSGLAAAGDGPRQPPCSVAAPPDWPRPSAEPVVTVWHPGALPPSWRLDGCARLTLPAEATLVGVVGRFHHQGDALSLLARLGQVSAQRQLRYWNVAAGRWLPLLADASPVTGAEHERRRPDFKLDELLAGKPLFLLYDDDESPGPVVFELEVADAGQDGFTATARSVTPMRLLGVTLAGPGDLGSVLAVRRLGPDEFGYYALSAAALSPFAMLTVPDSTLANRAVASFRFLAGIPSDREPPVVTQ